VIRPDFRFYFQRSVLADRNNTNFKKPSAVWQGAAAAPPTKVCVLATRLLREIFDSMPRCVCRCHGLSKASACLRAASVWPPSIRASSVTRDFFVEQRE
jgi:hypothetical protein